MKLFNLLMGLNLFCAAINIGAFFLVDAQASYLLWALFQLVIARLCYSQTRAA